MTKPTAYLSEIKALAPAAIMMMLIMVSLIPLAAFSQKTYPQEYFRMPLDVLASLSGSFGELRSSHFHSGIDFRTQGVEGLPVYASADGVVSRIRISPVGFGKALYVDHPNGYTTVYAHVRNFSPAIQNYIIVEQYRRESFDVDLYPEPGILKVKKGEIIAWSGNSGTSGGPHLHFEIRHTQGQVPVNPALFGLNIRDRVPPVIQRLTVYPADETSTVNGKNNPATFDLVPLNGVYTLAGQVIPELAGSFAFGVQYYDRHNDSNLNLGIVSMTVNVNAQQVFKFQIEKFAFDDTRYINAVVDYAELMTSGRRFLQTRIRPNNPLDFYRLADNRGVFGFTSGNIHKVEIILADSWNNTSKLEFRAKGVVAAERPGAKSDTLPGTLFRYNKTNSYTSPNLEMEMPPLALYEDAVIAIRQSESKNSFFPHVFQVHDKRTPLHLSYTLRLKAEGLPIQLQQKTVVVRQSDNGRWLSEGGKYDNGWMVLQTRSFGTFTLMADTMAPVITPVNISEGKTLAGQKTIQVKISDSLSGLRSYRGALNGRWILMDYDAKNDLLTYDFDDRLKKGKNQFTLRVEDNTGNVSTYEATLIKPE